MYPSKVIFTQTVKLDPDRLQEVVDKSFERVYSPKQTLEELLAELRAEIQSRINDNPAEMAGLESPYGLVPEEVVLKIDDSTPVHLAGVIDSRGQNLSFYGDIEYKEVQLVGFFDEKYMITPANTDIWNDFTEIIYIPKGSGLTIKKLQMLE